MPPNLRPHPWLARAAGLALAAAAVAPLSAAQASAAQASAAQASAAHAHSQPPAKGTMTRAATSGTLTTKASSVPNGNDITFRYSVPAAEVNAENWVGIYQAGQVPGQVGSITWQYTPGASGTVTFSSTSLYGVGSYQAYYLYDNEYHVLAGPVSFQVTASTPAPAPVFQRSFGGHGRGALAQPYGIALGPGNRDVWVADRAHNYVEEFTASGQPVTAVGQWGPGALRQPEGVAVDASGDVWVADTGGNRVEEFSPSGTELTSFGGLGSGDGQLDAPTGLAIAPSGDVYVADQGNNRIEEFSSSGGYLASIAVGTPFGVALDGSGDIWVSSPSYADGNAVYEFSPTGAQLQEFGVTQASYGAMSDVGGIAAGPHGRVYVAQPDYGWVSVYNPNGTFYTEFGLQPDPANAAENLAFPQALAVTKDGYVWVADSGNRRVAVFSPPPYAAPRTAAAVAPPPASRLSWIIGLLLAALVIAAVSVLELRRRRRPAGVSLPGVPATQASAPQILNGGQPMAAAEASAAPAVSRRVLLTSATALTGVAVGGVLPPNLRKALAATLKNPPRGGLRDIEHIVILMQENRSFDHYFGTFPGVRGFDDPTAITLPSGNPVYYQPDPSHAQGHLLPFHYDTRATSAQATPGTDHSWPTQHQAWDSGKMDQWIAAKGPYTMGYFKQQDIPFHWALAEAFTLCDNYHCSVLGPTNPNRLYMWTGMIDPYGTGGGPIVDNTPAFDNIILSWETYPERLQQAGISWQVYQEEDNYDDNALAWFKQYGYANTSSPLWQHGMVRKPAGWFESDALAGRLPQVSWLVAPTAQTEHPDYFPAAGAEYIAQKLDAIAANPDLWYTTAFILTYDENDGMFDHVPPPTAPPGTAGEWIPGTLPPGADGVPGPIGLGFRVPCTLVSPWTAGGHVYSDVLDHTSLIRFIESRFGVREPNISAWRRRTCGDFTSAFRFGRSAPYPSANARLKLATTEAGLLLAQQEVNGNPIPVPPAKNQPLPKQ
jgi:phospholipase C